MATPIRRLPGPSVKNLPSKLTQPPVPGTGVGLLPGPHRNMCSKTSHFQGNHFYKIFTILSPNSTNSLHPSPIISSKPRKKSLEKSSLPYSFIKTNNHLILCNIIVLDIYSNIFYTRLPHLYHSKWRPYERLQNYLQKS